MDKAERFLEILKKSPCPVEVEHKPFSSADAHAILMAEAVERLAIAMETGLESIASSITGQTFYRRG
jgi:hypothetical protein